MWNSSHTLHKLTLRSVTELRRHQGILQLNERQLMLSCTRLQLQHTALRSKQQSRLRKRKACQLKCKGLRWV